MRDGQSGELTIVSNRLPVVLKQRDDGWIADSGCGGLVQAMEPLLEMRGGRWVGWPGVVEGDDEGWKAALASARRGKGYELVPVVFSEEEYEGYYEGYANSVIWPLFHGLASRCDFDRHFSECYEGVNQRFGQALKEEVSSKGLVWVHDYHLMALGRVMRNQGHRGRLAFFLHIPFPSPEVFSRLPGGEALLADLLAYDQIGFQTARDRDHFRACVEQAGLARGVEEASGLWFEVGQRQVFCGAFPIGIDAAEFEARARSKKVAARARTLDERMGGRPVLLGVDRLDYTKGLVQRLEAWERALEREPELVESATFFQLLVPSRENVEEYRRLKERLDELVGRINGRFGTSVWQPIHYRYSGVDPEELAALYRLARAAVVTPLCDGMNLVAKEYCVSQVDEPGVLILSEFAGAADQLGEAALMVNPHDMEELSSAMVEALAMERPERRRRMAIAQKEVHASDVYRWAESFLEALGNPRPRGAETTSPEVAMDLGSMTSPT